MTRKEIIRESGGIIRELLACEPGQSQVVLRHGLRIAVCKTYKAKDASPKGCINTADDLHKAVMQDAVNNPVLLRILHDLIGRRAWQSMLAVTHRHVYPHTVR